MTDAATDYWALLDPRRRYPNQPIVDDDTEAILDAAVDALIKRRSPMWFGDAGATLHALASLTAQIDASLPDVVADAVDQDHSWADIAALLDAPSAAAIQRRYAHHANSRRLPLDPD